MHNLQWNYRRLSDRKINIMMINESQSDSVNHFYINLLNYYIYFYFFLIFKITIRLSSLKRIEWYIISYVLRDILCKSQAMKKIDFRILFFLCFFRIPHAKISLLVNFYINLIIFRYFFSGSNMCHNTHKNVYAFFAKSCYFLESNISCNYAQIFIKFFLFVYVTLFYKIFKKKFKKF